MGLPQSSKKGKPSAKESDEDEPNNSEKDEVSDDGDTQSEHSAIFVKKLERQSSHSSHEDTTPKGTSTSKVPSKGKVGRVPTPTPAKPASEPARHRDRAAAESLVEKLCRS